MTNFTAFSSLELKRFFRKRNVIIFLVLWLLLSGIVLKETSEYESLVQREEKFKKIEALNFEKFPNYATYGDEGISILYCPALLSIFFNNIGLSPDLIGKLDAIVKLRIFDNYKSKSLFRGIFAGIWSFAGIIFVFGSLLCLFWAAELLNDKEYLKLLSSFTARKKVFWFTILSRVILLVLLLLFIYLTALIILLAHGISLSAGGVAIFIVYFFASLTMLLFFFLAGVGIGIIYSKTGVVLPLMVVWIVFVFVITGLIQGIIESKTLGSIEDYKTEIKKFKVISNFEKRAIERNDEFNRNNIESERKLIEGYYKNDYPKIESLEEDLRSSIHANIELFNKLSLLAPSSFYYLTCIEVSSRGYESFMDFYANLRELKRNFVRFWIDRVFYHDPKVLVNFVQGDENIFLARSRLPKNFILGLALNILYIIVLSAATFWFFNHALFSFPAAEEKSAEEPDIKLDKGELKVWEVHSESFKSRLYAIFSGEIKRYIRKGYTRKWFIKGLDITANRNPGDFFYACHIDNIPGDIKILDFISFISRSCKLSREKKATIIENLKTAAPRGKRIRDLNNSQKGRLFLTILNCQKSDTYIIHDAARGMPIDFHIDLKEKMEALKEEGALIIYVTSNDMVVGKEILSGYFDSPTWTAMIDDFTRIKKYRESLRASKVR
ncbi:MAG: ABC transporter permease subunit [Candidatus Aminicenantes bacterium]|nr:ABC transporter permease subunit [Candidatus Aminicenantes bacterium]